jgi:hypothetical protein
MGTARRLTERVTSPFAGATVDREAGVIRGMLVCGVESLNKRRYPWGKGLTHKKGTYEGRVVNCDHGQTASVDRRLGWLANEQTDPHGQPRADLHVLKSHPLAGRVFEAAERNPALFGLSHVAMCRTRHEGGIEVVESIEEVESVDLVADPATTKGFFESKGGRAVPSTLRAVLESLEPRATPERKKLLRRVLVEMDDAPGMAGLADAPADEPDAATDPDEAIDDAFRQAMHAQVDALLDESHTLADFLSKCRELFKSRAKIMGKAEPKGGEGEGGEGEGGGDKSAESRKNAAAADLTREAIDVCRKVGFKGFDADDLDAIASVPAERRESLARKLMGGDRADAGAEKPKAGGRHQTAKLDEQKKGGAGGGAEPPEAGSGKAFREWVTESN